MTTNRTRGQIRGHSVPIWILFALKMNASWRLASFQNGHTMSKPLIAPDSGESVPADAAPAFPLAKVERMF
jgi:hypothetical protein